MIKLRKNHVNMLYSQQRKDKIGIKYFAQISKMQKYNYGNIRIFTETKSSSKTVYIFFKTPAT